MLHLLLVQRIVENAINGVSGKRKRPQRVILSRIEEAIELTETDDYLETTAWEVLL